MTNDIPVPKQHKLIDSNYLTNAIKAYRENKNLTTSDFADLVGISEALIVALEAGQHKNLCSSSVMTLMAVVFHEQFNSHDLQQYSDQVSRLNVQQIVVRTMVGHQAIYSGNFKRAADYLVAELAKTLKAQYVGIWLFDKNQDNLLGVSAYSLTGGKDSAVDYSRRDYPSYFNDVITRKTSVADFNNPNASGAKFLISLNAPAMAWGGRILQMERATVSNDFVLKAATELIRRAGYTLSSSIKYEGTDEEISITISWPVSLDMPNSVFTETICSRASELIKTYAEYRLLNSMNLKTIVH